MTGAVLSTWSRPPCRQGLPRPPSSSPSAQVTKPQWLGSRAGHLPTPATLRGGLMSHLSSLTLPRFLQETGLAHLGEPGRALCLQGQGRAETSLSTPGKQTNKQTSKLASRAESASLLHPGLQRPLPPTPGLGSSAPAPSGTLLSLSRIAPRDQPVQVRCASGIPPPSHRVLPLAPARDLGLSGSCSDQRAEGPAPAGIHAKAPSGDGGAGF